MFSFEYLYTQQATGQVDIENIGEFALSCTNDIFQEYILIVTTKDGFTQILRYGPHVIDNDTNLIPRMCSYNIIPFEIQKISNIITKFINEPRKQITQCTVIDKETALERIIDLRELLTYD